MVVLARHKYAEYPRQVQFTVSHHRILGFCGFVESGKIGASPSCSIHGKYSQRPVTTVTSEAIELLLGYTYSKSLDDSSNLAEAVNPFDVNLSKALSAFDMRHNFVISYQYKLPFGKLFRSNNRATSGWALSGITRFSTGLPVTLFNNTDTSLLGTIPNGINNDGIDTPEYSGAPLGLNLNPRNGKPAFNSGTFSLAALGTLGNAPRRFFYGPAIENFDMALQKNLPITESRYFQFRVEAFNVFNHAQFYGPAAVNGNIASANFGQIVSAAPPRELQIAAKFFFQ